MSLIRRSFCLWKPLIPKRSIGRNAARCCPPAFKHLSAGRTTCQLAASQTASSDLLTQIPQSPCASPILTELRLEEETLRYYEPDSYYPAHIGEVLALRYKIVGKLGYGSYSTVWLCRDLMTSEYHAAKITVSAETVSAHGLQQEIIINEHIKKTASLHAGRDALHIISEAFELNTDRSKHYCLLSAPVQMTLDDLLQNAKAHDASLDLTILRVVIHRLLLALSYLHDEAGVLHTDLKPDNIFLSLKDYAALSKFEDEERRCPSFRKNIDERLSIYQSRAMPLPKEAGVFQLGDFGQAIVVDKHPTCMQDIQPPLYRAPEVVMRTQWSLKADVWNLGCLIWYLVQGEHLFTNAFDSKGKYFNCDHIASMVALLGNPSKEFLNRGGIAAKVFDEDGNWLREKTTPIPKTTFEQEEKRFVGEEKVLFLDFMRSLLKWVPEERWSARKLLKHPWMWQDGLYE